VLEREIPTVGQSELNGPKGHSHTAFYTRAYEHGRGFAAVQAAALRNRFYLQATSAPGP